MNLYLELLASFMNRKYPVKNIHLNNWNISIKYAEASGFRRIKPDLCVQKQFVVHLALPW